VRLWDFRSRSPLQTLKTSDWVNAVTVSPEGSSLAVGLISGKIEIWDGRSVALLHKLKEHSSQVQDVAFSPHDGVISLASASNDKSVRLWHAQSGTEKLKIKAHPGMFNHATGVAFSPDRKVLASTS
jgi:WD40 repeat protein